MAVSFGPNGLVVPAYTVTQRNSLSPVVGELIYNSTEEEFEIYDGTRWININV